MKRNGASKEAKIDKLIDAIEDVYPSDKKLIWKSFLKGLFIGLGTTIGVSIVLAILTFSLGLLRNVPGVGDILEESKVEKIFPDTR